VTDGPIEGKSPPAASPRNWTRFPRFRRAGSFVQHRWNRRAAIDIRDKAVRHLAALPFKETIMSQEKPNGDPRQRTDWKSSKQTDEPWKGPVEKEQKPAEAKLDLEKWHDTNTH
jgi:hypothetical protein